MKACAQDNFLSEFEAAMLTYHMQLDSHQNNGKKG
jgi:hypothetical protein